MAVREGEDRRLGSGPEKLLTLEEAAQRLALPADDVEAMIRSGELAAFRLGGAHLRVRGRDIEAIRLARSSRSTSPALPSLWERFVEFLQFNDFYLISILMILTLLALIFAL